jgi:hypothetical protein
MPGQPSQARRGIRAGTTDNVGYVTRKPTCDATGRGSASILKKYEILEEDSRKSLMSFLL